MPNPADEYGLLPGEEEFNVPLPRERRPLTEEQRARARERARERRFVARAVRTYYEGRYAQTARAEIAPVPLRDRLAAVRPEPYGPEPAPEFARALDAARAQENAELALRNAQWRANVLPRRTQLQISPRIEPVVSGPRITQLGPLPPVRITYPTGGGGTVAVDVYRNPSPQVLRTLAGGFAIQSGGVLYAWRGAAHNTIRDFFGIPWAGRESALYIAPSGRPVSLFQLAEEMVHLGGGAALPNEPIRLAPPRGTATGEQIPIAELAPPVAQFAPPRPGSAPRPQVPSETILPPQSIRSQLLPAGFSAAGSLFGINVGLAASYLVNRFAPRPIAQGYNITGAGLMGVQLGAEATGSALPLGQAGLIMLSIENTVNAVRSATDAAAFVAQNPAPFIRAEEWRRNRNQRIAQNRADLASLMARGRAGMLQGEELARYSEEAFARLLLSPEPAQVAARDLLVGSIAVARSVGERIAGLPQAPAAAEAVASFLEERRVRNILLDTANLGIGVYLTLDEALARAVEGARNIVLGR